MAVQIKSGLQGYDTPLSWVVTNILGETCYLQFKENRSNGYLKTTYEMTQHNPEDHNLTLL
jgi:hypothetical protein